VPPDDLFELPLPFTLKSKIVSECPIVLTFGGHERQSKINITLWSRLSSGTATEKPKLANAIIRTGP
jgi:hypothetical protein